MEKDIETAKKEIKAMGFKVRTKQYSDFIAMTVYDENKNPMNNGLYICPPELAEQSRKFQNWKKENKGNIYCGMFRVVV